jgi:hypothetical protein
VPTVALSTWSRDPSAAPVDVLRRAAAVGAAAVALDATIDAAWAAELARARGEMPVVAVEAPCPRPRGAARAPNLATQDRDERRAAIAAMGATLELASEVGARLVVVRLGALDAKHDWPRTTRAFARRERVDAARLVAQRAQMSPRALDLARYGLDPVVERASAAGVTVGLANRARWWELPDAMELRALLDDFLGAPVAPFYDAAAGHARAALGLGPVQEWLALHGSGAAGAFLTDACGLRGGLPWGRGEVDHPTVLSSLPAATRIVHCAPGATDEELSSALSSAGR